MCLRSIAFNRSDSCIWSILISLLWDQTNRTAVRSAVFSVIAPHSHKDKLPSVEGNNKSHSSPWNGCQMWPSQLGFVSCAFGIVNSHTVEASLRRSSFSWSFHSIAFTLTGSWHNGVSDDAYDNNDIPEKRCISIWTTMTLILQLSS